VPRVVFDNVNKVFEAPARGTVNALSRFSLTVNSSEFLTIVGPSGSGKTTVLRLIAGLDNPSSGSISIGDEPVTSLPAAKRDVAMVFQNPALYPHMSVAQNLGFGLKVRRWSPSQAEQRVQEVADMLKLTPYLDSLPAELSGGQRQRVAIGRALARRAPLLLLDEPLANIDPALRMQMRTEIASLKKRLGTTTIYVTHDHFEALLLGDRVAVLHEGVLQQVADPVSLYRHPANLFVAGFFGTCPMNLFPGTLKHGGASDIVFEPSDGATTDRLGAACPVSLEPWINHPVILGVRAENMCVVTQSNNNGAQFTGKITLVENAGSELYAHGTWASHPFVARVPLATPLTVGRDHRFHIDPIHCCWFNPSTGQAIS
jgi:ABC-type sugar transport system ATPase subunit